MAEQTTNQGNADTPPENSNIISTALKSVGRIIGNDTTSSGALRVILGYWTVFLSDGSKLTIEAGPGGKANTDPNAMVAQGGTAEEWAAIKQLGDVGYSYNEAKQLVSKGKNAKDYQAIVDALKQPPQALPGGTTPESPVLPGIVVNPSNDRNHPLQPSDQTRLTADSMIGGLHEIDKQIAQLGTPTSAEDKAKLTDLMQKRDARIAEINGFIAQLDDEIAKAVAQEGGSPRVTDDWRRSDQLQSIKRDLQVATGQIMWGGPVGPDPSQPVIIVDDTKIPRTPKKDPEPDPVIGIPVTPTTPTVDPSAPTPPKGGYRLRLGETPIYRQPTDDESVLPNPDGTVSYINRKTGETKNEWPTAVRDKDGLPVYHPLIPLQSSLNGSITYPDPKWFTDDAGGSDPGPVISDPIIAPEPDPQLPKKKPDAPKLGGDGPMRNPDEQLELAVSSMTQQMDNLNNEANMLGSTTEYTISEAKLKRMKEIADQRKSLSADMRSMMSSIDDTIASLPTSTDSSSRIANLQQQKLRLERSLGGGFVKDPTKGDPIIQPMPPIREPVISDPLTRKPVPPAGGPRPVEKPDIIVSPDPKITVNPDPMMDRGLEQSRLATMSMIGSLNDIDRQLRAMGLIQTIPDEETKRRYTELKAKRDQVVSDMKGFSASLDREIKGLEASANPNTSEINSLKGYKKEIDDALVGGSATSPDIDPTKGGPFVIPGPSIKDPVVPDPLVRKPVPPAGGPVTPVTPMPNPTIDFKPEVKKPTPDPLIVRPAPVGGVTPDGPGFGAPVTPQPTILNPDVKKPAPNPLVGRPINPVGAETPEGPGFVAPVVTPPQPTVFKPEEKKPPLTKSPIPINPDGRETPEGPGFTPPKPDTPTLKPDEPKKADPPKNDPAPRDAAPVATVPTNVSPQLTDADLKKKAEEQKKKDAEAEARLRGVGVSPTSTNPSGTTDIALKQKEEEEKRKNAEQMARARAAELASAAPDFKAPTFMDSATRATQTNNTRTTGQANNGNAGGFNTEGGGWSGDASSSAQPGIGIDFPSAGTEQARPPASSF